MLVVDAKLTIFHGRPFPLTRSTLREKTRGIEVEIINDNGFELSEPLS